MRAGPILIAFAAFGAGVLVGHLATPRSPGTPRARVEGSADRTARGAPADTGQTSEAGSASGTPAAPLPATGSPDTGVPLVPGIGDAPRDEEEFRWWYAIHREEWDLPDLDEAALKRCARVVNALGRIPRRDVLFTILRDLEAMDKALAPALDEWKAWATAHGPAPLGDPTAAAYRQRLTDVRQRFADRLHRELSYSDYRLVLDVVGDDVEARPPPGGPLPGGDPYAGPVAEVTYFHGFARWYHAYAFDLGFPEREWDFLENFHQHVVVPLGRLPEPALMRRLQEAYAPLYPSLREGSDPDTTIPGFFDRLARILAPLDYERVRHSYEWKKEAERLSVPGAERYLPAGR